MTISKRVVLIAAILAALSFVFGSAAPPAALAAATRIVDDDYPSLAACPGAGYATIQDAVNSFNPGKSGTIQVCAGAYNENVSISNLGKIKLLGLTGATLTPLTTNALITATNTKLLTVQGLVLDGASNGSEAGVILLQDTSGVISNNLFQNAPDCNGVHAEVASRSRSVKVAYNKFMGVGGGVYGVSYSGKLSMKVTGNELSGGLNGVSVGAGYDGRVSLAVTGNYLQGLQYGINVQNVDKVRISGNTLLDFTVGVNLADSSRSRVTGNTVRSPFYGIALAALETRASSNRVQGNTLEASSGLFKGIYIINNEAIAADFNQIKDNIITDPLDAYVGTIGIQLVNVSGTLHKTAIKGNTLVNMDGILDRTGDTGTIISGNTCSPALPCFP